jgi:hypothetical protein
VPQKPIPGRIDGPQTQPPPVGSSHELESVQSQDESESLLASTAAKLKCTLASLREARRLIL